MKKFLSALSILAVLVFFTPIPAQATGVAFDAAEAADNFGTGASTSFTFNHTVTGSNPSLFVGFVINSTTDTVTAVTYNGVTMTRGVALHNTTGSFFGNEWMYMYVLPNAPTGTHAIIITTSNSVNTQAAAASYTGTDTTTQPDGANSFIATTLTTSDTAVPITTSSAGSWGVMFDAQSRSSLAGTGSVARATAGNSQAAIIDSNGAFVSTGSNSVNYKSNASLAAQADNVIVGIKAFAAAPSTPTPFINGLVQSIWW